MKFLKKHFPEIKQLYPYQERALSYILEKKNTLSIVPTGGGKSLVFQLGALELDGTTLVISPLKALMMEQVDELNKRGIPAIAFNSDISFEEQRKILRNLATEQPKLMYVSPERLYNYLFRASLLFNKIKIPLVVIDEAHCISQWGIDFRPEYGCIRPFLRFLDENAQESTLLALTATLGIEARNDIKNEFLIQQEQIENNVIRNNLRLNFKKVTDDDSKFEEISSFIQEKNLKKVIVYLYSRSKCEELAQKMPGSEYFHAGLESNEKRTIINKFKNGEIKVLFATTAFGMGINIPDIDGVIHHDIPASVEEYYQHVGRGARDKNKCPECHGLMLWSDKNFDIKQSDFKRDSLKKEHLEKSFELMNLTNKAGKKTFFDENALIHNTGKWGRVNLRLIYRLFEKHGVCSTIGEVHGKIGSIVFKEPTALWNYVLEKMGRRQSYLFAEAKTGIPLQEIISHIYEQELMGNISKFPASQRTLFLQSNYDNLPDDKIEDILQENEKVRQFKLDRLSELRKLCDAPIPEKYIAEVLGVTY